MSAFYEQLRAEAGQLLADLGCDMVVKRYMYEANLVEGTSYPVLQSQQTLKGITLPTAGETIAAFDVSFMDGVKDLAKVRLALMSAEGAEFSPAPKDTILLGSTLWTVFGCTALDLDGTELLYTVGLDSPRQP